MRAPYLQESRDDIVRLARSRKDSVTITQDSGVHEMTIGKWIRQADMATHWTDEGKY